MTLKNLLHFFLKLIAFTILLGGIHYYIFYNFFAEIALYIPIWGIYLFNAALVFIVFSLIYYKVSNGSNKSYQLFLIATLIKMMLAIVFLMPLFFGKSAYSVVEVINFFIPYLLFLAFEIYSLNNFLKSQQTN